MERPFVTSDTTFDQRPANTRGSTASGNVMAARSRGAQPYSSNRVPTLFWMKAVGKRAASA